MDLAWTCPGCRRSFTTLSMDYDVAAPMAWTALPEAERAARAELTDDLCTIDGRQHFVHGCIEIPMEGMAQPFIWGVWVAISDKSRRRILSLWERKPPKNEPPQLGTLDTWIGVYPEPVDVGCRIHVRAGDQRPLVVPIAPDYPLTAESRTILSVERVKAISSHLGHV